MNNEIFRVLKKEELTQVAGGEVVHTMHTQNACHMDGTNDAVCSGSGSGGAIAPSFKR
jgi:hypothetical protein